ncbi:lysophospholipid acyltransferase family protein [Streptomyces sp. KLOTTS4A1]|uniref:lysophospholipid acyltransferase family protein n=1 Tax=Streptomyces sp. KLOTTS4A1 TaxID=3390996 RepID=UPI0039F5D732
MNPVWAVHSPCTSSCVRDRARPVSARTALRRITDFAAVVAGTATRQRTLTDPEAVRLRAQHLLAALEVRQLDGHGGPGAAGAWRPSGEGAALSAPGPVGTLIVANHISWLDVIALLAREPVTLIAKREVGGWPLVGGLARRAGTCFIDRDGFRRLPEQVAAVRQLLCAGRSVAVFPQATTWCTEHGGTFRRAMFQAAVDAGAPVRPVTLAYRQHGVPTTVAAFVGEDGFLPSLGRVARADGLSVSVEPHAFLLPGLGRDRRGLARAAQEAVLTEGVAAHGRPPHGRPARRRPRAAPDGRFAAPGARLAPPDAGFAPPDAGFAPPDAAPPPAAATAPPAPATAPPAAATAGPPHPSVHA